MRRQKVKQITVKFTGDGPVNDRLRAAIKSPAVGLPPKIAFNHRYCAKVDCGVEAEAPDGCKICIALIPELAEKGMVLTNAPGNFKRGRITATLLNAGREIVEVHNGDPIVTCWVEADLYVPWETA